MITLTLTVHSLPTSVNHCVLLRHIKTLIKFNFTFEVLNLTYSLRENHTISYESIIWAPYTEFYILLFFRGLNLTNFT